LLGGVGPSSYDGKVAGEAAAMAARSAKPALPRAALNAEQQRVFGFLVADRDGVRPMAAKLRIREIMWELGYVKNETKLNAALEGIVVVREQMVPKLRLQSASRNWNTGWMDALDACSMIDASEAMVRSALLRKESRGPFYREDYPYVDNENWLRKIVLTRDGREWKSRTEPYALPHLKPEKSREPFFEADF
jgi:succinate dehydrogenase / fumarate reductase flavoprotein subunit